MNYQYTYILGDAIILFLWLILFLWRKDTRKEMLIVSFIFGLGGPVAELVHLNDWWKPLTITRTAVGVEDFLFGFGIGGIASVIYCHIFNKRIKSNKVNKKKDEKRNLNLIFLISLVLFIYLASFYIFKLNTLVGTILAFTIPISIIYMKRSNLIKDSILSGIVLVVLSFFGYHLLNLITPGFFEEFWIFQNIGRIIVLGIPLEEYIWFFLAGAFIGPLYEYWQEAKLVNN